MKQLLKRIGLVENFTIMLPVERSDFVKVLSANIDKPGIDVFEVFSKSKNAYKGTVNYDSFELKRRRKFFDRGANLIKFSGRLKQKSDKLEVDLELTAFHPMMIPFVALGVIVYSVLIVTALAGVFGITDGNDVVPVWTLPFLLVHAGIMFGLPYYLLRRSLQSAKYNIERDIFFMMKGSLSGQQVV